MSQRAARVVSGHAEAKEIELAERARMSPEERLRIGAELHYYWVRNFYPNATRLDRTVQVLRRPLR